MSIFNDHPSHPTENNYQLLKAIFESSYDGIFVTNYQGTTIGVNKAYERITGIKTSDVLGQHIKDLEDYGMFTPIITPTILQTQKSLTVIQKFKTGKQAVITGNPVFNDKGELIYIITNVRDITELKNLRHELKKATELTERYENELSLLRIYNQKHHDIIAESSKMKHVITAALQVARFDTTVLVLGRSGVGKEIVAKLVHSSSLRNNHSFIKINCGAISPNLLESELFGYEAGAFTGALHKGKPGLFEVAHEGTLFLDEIGELPQDLQVKLLRVLQEQEIYRVGSITPKKVDVRILAATNQNLEELVEKGKFRADLYYRLNVVPIEIPSLRERKEDIVPLLHYFCEKYNTQHHMQKHFLPQTMEILENYHWPGNVRELKNVVERLIIMSPENELLPKHLPDNIRNSGEKAADDITINKILPLKQALREVEEKLVLMAQETGGSTRKIAALLGVSQSTVVRRLQQIGERKK
ncbi:MAG: sigma-54 interaction domain-containing protein [Peptococcaceae bacterium]